MNKLEQKDIADASLDSPADFNARISSLRAAGADKFDPVRLHYIEVLIRRAAEHQGSVKRVLDAKVAQALATFRERFDQAQSDATKTALPKTDEPCESLGALVRQLEQHSLENTDAPLGKNAESRSELKTIRNFRNTWSKLSADRQVAHALDQAPTNAGPINSHMLVLRSLALMRDISPDYLNRFMSYADTLLCLDQYEKEKPGNPKKHQTAKTAKK